MEKYGQILEATMQEETTMLAPAPFGGCPAPSGGCPAPSGGCPAPSNVLTHNLPRLKSPRLRGDIADGTAALVDADATARHPVLW